MMWVRLDCTLATHRKMLRAGAEAAWLWVCGLAYANQHTTDGVIPREALTALYPCDDWSPAKRRSLVAKLVEVGLWEVRDGDSWMIHGYAEHQSEAMSEAVDARRERERDKKRLQRDREKQSRSGGVSPGDTHGDTRGSPREMSPPMSPPVPGVSPPSDRPTDRPTGERDTPARAREDINATVDDQPRAPTRERESIASANGPSTTPQSRTLLDDLRTATGARATLVGTLAEERGLADMLARLSPTPDEVRAMGVALGASASWWPQGKTPAPKHVTLRALSGFRGADGQPEWGPLAGLVAHVRAKGVAQRVRPLPRPVVDDGGVTEEDIRFGAERAAALRAKLAQGGGR